MNKKTCIFIIFLVISFISNAQVNENGNFEINNFKDREIRLEGWKYISDDNPEYANPNYNDSDWQQLDTHEDFRQFMDSKFSGFGWFRLKIIIADSLKDQIFALSIFQAGAMQIFANGILTESLGKPSENQSDEKLVYTELRPFAVKFDSDTVVLAIKYSQHNNSIIQTSKFSIYIGKSNYSFSSVYSQIREIYSFAVLFGFLLALSIVHLLLFAYYPEQKENLYHSLFIFSLVLITINELIIHSTLNYYYFLYSGLITVFFVLSTFVFLQKLLYEIFKLKKRVLIYYYVFGILLFSFSFFVFRNFNFSLIITLIILIVDIIRAIIIGIIKKIYGYKYVITGSLIFIFGAFFHFWKNNYTDIDSFLTAYIIISIFFLALPISMSIFLARKSSDTNKDLSKQLIKVKDLSAKTLAQEQEKKRILENQKEKLEQQVKERTAEVVQQKEEIEDKNKHITDSITYASRIQKAILGNSDDIISNFKDAFIFLKPHSIVSGDFYWFTKIKNTNIGEIQIIIAADCTGHGVPGAFMTVMGHDFLEEIVNKQSILLPNKILHELDKRVISNLKKQTSVEQVDDGMDIAVIVYAKDKQILYFSGANNPMFYIRNNELFAVKGSRFAIGGELFGKEQKKEFDLHKMDVKENDKFYIFSDGFQDQFGGKKNRKYMVKPFKELLLQNSKFAMSEQKQRIEDELHRWKSNRSQTDDILIVGVEF